MPGYETSWGSFGQFCKVQGQQLLPKPPALTWEEAACYGLTYFTAYRMLVTQTALRAGHRVLMWGAAGGLGVFALQLCRLGQPTPPPRSPSSCARRPRGWARPRTAPARSRRRWELERRHPGAARAQPIVSRGGSRVIQHIVLVKWKPGTTEEEILDAFRDARRLLDEIDFVQNLTLGRNRGESDHGFTHALIVNLANEDALRDYLDHPARSRYVTERLQPLEEQRIEIDVPVDMALRRDPGTNWEWGASVGMGPPLED